MNEVMAQYHVHEDSTIETASRKIVGNSLLRHMTALEEEIHSTRNIDLDRCAVDAYFFHTTYRLNEDPETPMNTIVAINEWLSDLDYLQIQTAAANADNNEIPEELNVEDDDGSTTQTAASSNPADVLARISQLAQHAKQAHIAASDINKWLTPNTSHTDTRKKLSLSSTPSGTDTVDHHTLIMRKMQSHIDKSMLKVNSIFKQFDTSGDGLLSKVEFRKGIEAILATALFTVSKAEINGIFNRIDVDGSKEVSYREFLQELRNADPVRQAALLAHKNTKPTLVEKQELARQETMKELELKRLQKNTLKSLNEDVDPFSAVSQRAQQFLKKNMQKAINLFREMDTSGDGLIDEGELREGMKLLGLDLTNEEFQSLWRGLDSDGSGACDMKELEAALRDTGTFLDVFLRAFVVVFLICFLFVFCTFLLLFFGGLFRSKKKKSVGILFSATQIETKKFFVTSSYKKRSTRIWKFIVDFMPQNTKIIINISQSCVS